MPIHKGQDKRGSYWEYGHQKKYYFNTPKTSMTAKKKAIKQGLAIIFSQGKQKQIKKLL